MKLPIGLILSGIEAGIPALERITRLFKKKKKTDVSVLSPVELADKVNQLEASFDESKIEWLIKTLITLGTVYFIVWTSKQLGVTYQDIITLMGLLN